MHKIEFSLASSETIEDALSERIEAIRLSRNITQSRLAKAAGVSRSTITRLAQTGKGISLDSFIRILKALDLESQLELLLPLPAESPLERLQKPSKARQRARLKGSKKSATKSSSGNESLWTWEDAGSS